MCGLDARRRPARQACRGAAGGARGRGGGGARVPAGGRVQCVQALVRAWMVSTVDHGEKSLTRWGPLARGGGPGGLAGGGRRGPSGSTWDRTCNFTASLFVWLCRAADDRKFLVEIVFFSYTNQLAIFFYEPVMIRTSQSNKSWTVEC